MKLFLVLFFVGCVSASFQDAFEEASDDAMQSFMQGIEESPDIENNDALQRFERNTKEELRDYMRRCLKQVVARMEEEMRKGKPIDQQALKDLKEMQAKVDTLEITDNEVEGFKPRLDKYLIRILIDNKIIPDIYKDKKGKRSIKEYLELLEDDFYKRIKSFEDWVKYMFDRITNKSKNQDKRFERDTKEDLRDYTRNCVKQVVDALETAIKEGKPIDKQALKDLKDMLAKVDYLEVADKDVEGYRPRLDKYLIRILIDNKIIPDIYKIEKELREKEIGKRSINEYLELLQESLKERIGLFENWVGNMIDLIRPKKQIEKRTVSEYLEFLKKDFKERIEFFKMWLRHMIDQISNKSHKQIEKRSIKEYLELLEKGFKERIEFFENWVKHMIDQITNKSKNQIEKRTVSEYLELLKKEFKERVEFVKIWFRYVVDQIRNKSKSQIEKRSVEEYLELLKDDFHKRLDFYRKWLKNVVENGIDMSKSRIENIRTFAHEILNKTKHMSKEVAQEALEFVRQYKEELGYMYDILQRRIMDKISEYTD